MDMIRFKSLTWTEKLSVVTMFYPGTLFFLGGGIRRKAWVNYPCGLLTHTILENTMLKYRLIPTTSGKEAF